MFHLFAGYDYYPNGGMNDYIGVFTTLTTAKNRTRLRKSNMAWAHVVEVVCDKLIVTWTWDHSSDKWSPASE